MAPRFVLRALAFGLVTFAIVLGADLLAADGLKWAWFQDPSRVPLRWPPPHLFFHQSVLALSAAGALVGLYVNRSEPLRWPVMLATAAGFGLATLVGVPVVYLWQDELGVIGWLFMGPVLAVWSVNEARKP